MSTVNAKYFIAFTTYTVRMVGLWHNTYTYNSSALRPRVRVVRVLLEIPVSLILAEKVLMIDDEDIVT